MGLDEDTARPSHIRALRCNQAKGQNVSAIHYSDFSNQGIRQLVRDATSTIFASLPDPESSLAKTLQAALDRTGPWCFRGKTRLEPGGSDCPSLARWLAFLKSDEGQKWAGGTISQYLSPSDADRPSVDLKARMRDLADMFRPWIEASGPIVIPPVADTLRPTFEELLHRLPKARATKT
jgi:hypothetical protein